jgi:ABC-2 type transport system ATP-binding protein
MRTLPEVAGALNNPCAGPPGEAVTVASVKEGLMGVIEARGLRKEYRRLRGGSTVALDGLDLEVPEGGVFGFLGPNGSGKTTTIRCLLGLVRQSSGDCRVLGADRTGLPSVIGKIGSIVEAPAFFPRFSGRRNLEYLAMVQGVDKKRVDWALAEVGLATRAKDLVRTYSLGMKQRLGIAAALLKDPRLLILDEPANGLDPAGIKEVRELLRRLGSEGRTVFVSSHILSEVEQVADQVAILARGRCLTSGPVHELLSAKSRGLVVKVEQPQRAVEILGRAGMDATLVGDQVRVEAPSAEGARVTKALADAGLYLSELRADEVDLESFFLELTESPTKEVGQ